MGLLVLHKLAMKWKLKIHERTENLVLFSASMKYDPELERTGKAVLDASFRVHNELGPGLLEIVYEAALARELAKRGHVYLRQQAVPVHYDGELLTEVGFRADLIVNSLVLVELKSVAQIADIHKKTVWNYLRLIPLSLGYLINFNELHLKQGITRITNGAEGKPFWQRTTAEREIDGS